MFAFPYRRRGRLVFSLLVGLASFVLGGLSVYALLTTTSLGEKPSGDPEARGPAVSRVAVSALGRLQPIGGIIALAGPPGDRIGELKVKQGEEVKAGTVLVVLESSKDRALEYRLARVQYDEAKTQRTTIAESARKKIAALDLEAAQLEPALKDELRTQEAGIGVFKAQAAQARTQLLRLTSLTSDRIAPEELEQQRLLSSKAAGELAAAQTLLETARHQFERQRSLAAAKRSAAEAERDDALQRVPLLSLKRSVELAERRRETSWIKAPCDGRVLRVLSHVGEATGGQEVLELAGGQEMIALAEVSDTDLPVLHGWLAEQGTVEAVITCRALDGLGEGAPLRGRLTDLRQIAGILARNSVVSLNPRGDTDRHVAEVRVTLDPDSAAKARPFVGLQVEVDFHRPQ